MSLKSQNITHGSAYQAVVLLSSGLDSTVNLYAALHEYSGAILALTFDYRQKAAQQEIAKSAALVKHLQSQGRPVQHQVIDLSFFSGLGKSSLNTDKQEVPVQKSVSIDDHQVSTETAKAVWVPNRNGVFLNIAAAVAEGRGAQLVIPGFNREEASTFPDNSEDYLQSLNKAFHFSTANGVQVKCFTTALDKVQIVQKGLEWAVPWKMIWPCYFSGDKWCGQCESCQRSRRAFTVAGVADEDLLYI
jgi:7-cyano-7-deazaguanine synthase